ncbi:MAG: N-formylglutamate amidohydrolase [Brucellaceae bacterium]|nr:N-formylglutamate amidohydrolase [Brucellaceae bacterium]
MTRTGVLNADEPDPVAIERPQGGSRILLVCEHASNRMPRSLGTLGMVADALESHVAWDIGALGVSLRLSEILDATLIHQRYSRLVYDCNRPPEATDSIPEKSEVFHIPANANLTLDERRDRARVLYTPFQEAIGAELDRRVAERREKPVLVTVHSYTGRYFGADRDPATGILHDEDSRLADAMLDIASRTSGVAYRRNHPYGPEDGVTHTLRRQALPRGIPNVMIEICNAHIADEAGQDEWAERLADLLTAAIERLDHAVGGDRSVA